MPILPEKYECAAIIGPANPHGRLLHQAYENQPRVRLISDVSNMQPHFSSAKIVITGAGSSVWECLYLGTPIITIVLAKNQQKIAAFLEERLLACNAGDVKSENFSKSIKSCIRTYFHKRYKFEHNAARGKKLIDGRGALRVLKLLGI